MTDTANAPERIQAWMQPNFSEIGSWSVTRYPEVTIEYVLATHCDELVAAAYLDARDSINEYPRVAPEADEANAYDEQIEHCQGIIDARIPANALAALTARDERMKAEGALEAQAKIARLTEALKEIAHQKKTSELDTEYDVECADFEAGYDACIDRARAALQENADG